MSRESRRRKRRNERRLITLCISLPLIYLAGVIFFHGHFPLRSSIGGVNVSMMSPESAMRVITGLVNDYELTVSGREGVTDVLRGEDVGLRPISEESARDMLKSFSAFAWPVALFRDTELHLSSARSASDDLLKLAVKQMKHFGADVQRPPVNASIVYEPPQYVLVAEDPGTTLDEARVFDVVKGAVENLRSELDLDSSGCYVRPQISSGDKDLQTALETMNRYAGTNLTFTFGQEEVRLDADTIHAWVSFDYPRVMLDETGIANFVRGLANSYDTFGTPRQFRTSRQEVITIRNSHYGWWMDQAETTQIVKNAILEGAQQAVEPVYKATASTFGDTDFGGDYVEIDLDNQHLWVYKGGVLRVETDFVSGKAIDGHATPPGIFPITYKTKDAVLRGEDYETPVKYWIPFNGNVGMHDASWRSTFGGTRYVTNGSHGCVNLPPAMAKVIYDNVEKGEAVIVYGGMNQEQARVFAGIPEEPAVKMVKVPATDENGNFVYDENGVIVFTEITEEQYLALQAAMQAAEGQTAEAPAQEQGIAPGEAAEQPSEEEQQQPSEEAPQLAEELPEAENSGG